MIQQQDEYVINIVAPGTVSTTATASARIDTLGFDYVVIDCTFPVATATNSSAKWLALSVSEADLTTVSSATSIAAFSVTTNTSSATGFVIPPQNDTTNPQITRLMIDTKARKRYLFLTYEGGSSHSTVSVQAILARASITPSSDAQRGANVTTVIG